MALSITGKQPELATAKSKTNVVAATTETTSSPSPMPPTSTPVPKASETPVVQTVTPTPTRTGTPQLTSTPTPSPIPMTPPRITSPSHDDQKVSGTLEIKWEWDRTLQSEWRYDVLFFWDQTNDPFHTVLCQGTNITIDIKGWSSGEVFITVRVVEVNKNGTFTGKVLSLESKPVKVREEQPPPTPTPTPRPPR